MSSKRLLNFYYCTENTGKCLSHSGKMHFSVSGHVILGVARWRHELDYICPLWVLSKFGPIEAYRCRVIANWFFPSNGIKRYFNEPLKQRFLSLSLILWYKTNRMWLSVVCILVDNDTGRHSRQDLLWNHWFIHACRHKQNFHGNLNGFLVTFSTIFTSFLWQGLWRVSFRTLWRVWYSSKWHFLSLN